MNIIEYLNEWEARNEKCRSLKVEIKDDTVLAYLLLKRAILNEDQETLIRTTLADFTFDEMKTKIRAMCNQMHFSSGTEPHQESLGLPIKVEPSCSYGESNVLYSRNSCSQNRG